MMVGSRHDVALLHDRLAVYRGHHLVSGAGQVAYGGPAELRLGCAARYLDRLDDAVTDLQHAAATCDANGAVGFQTEAEYELGATLAQRSHPGDHTRARSLLTECASRARSLGMKPFEAKAHTLLDELGDRRPSPLTPREHEVAELVGQGLRIGKSPNGWSFPSAPPRTTYSTSSPSSHCRTAVRSPCGTPPEDEYRG